MGSGFSHNAQNPLETETGLGDLPEGCVASVLVHLDPPEICRLARLNRAFRDALVGRFRVGIEIASEFYIYEVVDLGCVQKVWLDKSTGRLCLSISSTGLAITGIDDRRYWNRIPTEESRFGTVAYLQQIWWFEVDGEVEFPFPAGTYSLFFRLQLGRSSKRFGRRVCNSEHVHGWGIKPVRFQLSTSDGQEAIFQCFLDEPGKWVHYHVGDFVVEDPNTPMKVKFSMTQIDCTHTKGGICLDSVVIYPNEFRERLKCF
ncbi:phloem protein 2-A12 [Actinidia rufa]|uniref:Phloem protein 2-A12 n=1 Tax=Actinidia rufa TaxID=165716 RepID=A0A7J0G8B9_9ERIC|nr:phloem protein 2-A12 [Actinidia rufa]